MSDRKGFLRGSVPKIAVLKPNPIVSQNAKLKYRVISWLFNIYIRFSLFSYTEIYKKYQHGSVEKYIFRLFRRDAFCHNVFFCIDV